MKSRFNEQKQSVALNPYSGVTMTFKERRSNLKFYIEGGGKRQLVGQTTNFITAPMGTAKLWCERAFAFRSGHSSISMPICDL